MQKLDKRVVQSITDKLRNSMSLKAPKARKPQQSQATRNRIARQERRSMRAKINGSLVAPSATSAVKRQFLEIMPPRSRYPGSIRIRGMEPLGPLTLGTGLSGEVLFQQPISPSSFQGTRLAQFGDLYEKFLFKNLRFHYVPNVGTQSTGSIVMAYDRDIKDALTNTTLNAKIASSMQNALQIPIWGETVMGCLLSFPEDGYYTGGNLDDADVRLSFQGQMYVVNNTGFTGGSGTIWLEYDLDMFVPILTHAGLLEQRPVYYNMYVPNYISDVAVGLNSVGALTNVLLHGAPEESSSDEGVALVQPPTFSDAVVRIPADLSSMNIDFQHTYQLSTAPSGWDGYLWDVEDAFYPLIFNKAGVNITTALIDAGNLFKTFSTDMSQLYWGYPGPNTIPNVFRTVWQLGKLAYDVYVLWKCDYTNNSSHPTLQTTTSVVNPTSVTITDLSDQDFVLSRARSSVLRNRRIERSETKIPDILVSNTERGPKIPHSPVSVNSRTVQKEPSLGSLVSPHYPSKEEEERRCKSSPRDVRKQ